MEGVNGDKSAKGGLIFFLNISRNYILLPQIETRYKYSKTERGKTIKTVGNEFSAIFKNQIIVEHLKRLFLLLLC